MLVPALVVDLHRRSMTWGMPKSSVEDVPAANGADEKYSAGSYSIPKELVTGFLPYKNADRVGMSKDGIPCAWERPWSSPQRTRARVPRLP